MGTSTGGLLAVALGLRHMTLDECTFIYKVLGQKVFSKVVAGKEGKDETWMEVCACGWGDEWGDANSWACCLPF